MRQRTPPQLEETPPQRGRAAVWTPPPEMKKREQREQHVPADASAPLDFVFPPLQHQTACEQLHQRQLQRPQRRQYPRPRQRSVAVEPVPVLLWA
jgi:hypothetical protein